jgi:hypothetical protein
MGKSVGVVTIRGSQAPAAAEIMAEAMAMARV